MARYKVELEQAQEGFIMVADLVQASAQICWEDEDEEVQPSPYQTADARHDADLAAQLLVDYFAANGSDEDIVASVEEL